jgi:hypothetical protein
MCVVDPATRRWQLQAGETLIGSGGFQPRLPAPPVDEQNVAAAPEDFYGRLLELGIAPTPEMRPLSEVRVGAEAATARLLGPDSSPFDPATEPWAVVEGAASARRPRPRDCSGRIRRRSTPRRSRGQSWKAPCSSSNASWRWRCIRISRPSCP